MRYFPWQNVLIVKHPESRRMERASGAVIARGELCKTSDRAYISAMPKQSVITTKEIAHLVQQVRHIVLSARALAARRVDTVQVAMNFAIGQRIVEYEQQGKKRAAYGERVIESLAQSMSSEFGRGFSATNLKLMRQFYLAYAPRMSQTASDQSGGGDFCGENFPARLPSLARLASLSWSHYVLLLTISNPQERMFYEIESARQGWDARTLKRQVASCLYERLALSRNKEGVGRLANEGDLPQTPRQLIKDPLVLEFLGLEERSQYSEHDLESAIIDRLESFLLELGRGSSLRPGKNVFRSAQTIFTWTWSFSIGSCAVMC